MRSVLSTFELQEIRREIRDIAERLELMDEATFDLDCYRLDQYIRELEECLRAARINESGLRLIDSVSV